MSPIRPICRRRNAPWGRSGLSPLRELVDSVVVSERKDGEPLNFVVKGRLSGLLNMADGTADKASAGMLVPRDRIELPTRGFSIRCSTN